jgi:8-oxo-dGTP pyrophosphatase MutT (NUDIX family)
MRQPTPRLLQSTTPWELSVLDKIISHIEAHRAFDHAEASAKAQTLAFIRAHPDCLHRSCLQGHLTASAWILSSDLQAAVLLHHKKLDRWFQPGGHVDGNPNLLESALREAAEETGLQVSDFNFASRTIFDIDAHTIPARPNEPKHTHFDIRYALTVDYQELPGNAESHDVRFVSLAQVRLFNNTSSVVRLVRKTTDQLITTSGHRALIS